jgi:mannose-6-phosphate isomerase-like protein (cupin superfamily)
MQYVFKSEPGVRYRFPHHITDLIVDRSETKCTEVFMVLMEPGAGNPLHRHVDTEQIFYILEGAGILTIGQERQQFPLVPGDVVRIPPCVWHSAEASGVRLKYFCVDGFPGPLPENETTWDDHIKVVCATQGWDFNGVRAAAAPRPN